MKQAKPRPRVGDTCWWVSWTYELAFEDDEQTVIDRDSCKERERKCATKEEAERVAKEVYPQTVGVFGFVEYWPATFVAYDADDAVTYPHAGHWESDVEWPEVYEGEEP